jgi:DNA polymerase-4
MARGVDDRPVRTSHRRKSLGKERTFAKDVSDPEEMLEILGKIAEMVEAGLRRTGKKGRTVTLKVKYHDFKVVTRAETAPDHIWDAKTMMEMITPLLLEQTEAAHRPVRLLGISLSNLIDVEENWVQTKLVG